MDLPFSKEQFLEVFAAYNTAVWPAQIVLNVLALVLLALALRWPEKAGRWIAGGLALLWAWVGIAYHLMFFRDINPAAPLFATLCIAASLVFLWQGVIRNRLNYRAEKSGMTIAGLLFVIFSLLVYPAIGTAMGDRYPAIPTFGLPCPVTLFTVGMLLLAVGNLPRAMLVGPLLWSLIGSLAAFSLDIYQDLGLIAAAATCIYLMTSSKGAEST